MREPRDDRQRAIDTEWRRMTAPATLAEPRRKRRTRLQRLRIWFLSLFLRPRQ